MCQRCVNEDPSILVLPKVPQTGARRPSETTCYETFSIRRHSAEWIGDRVLSQDYVMGFNLSPCLHRQWFEPSACADGEPMGW